MTLFETLQSKLLKAVASRPFEMNIQLHLKEHNNFIQKLLDKPNKSEAFAWLDESTDESYRTVSELESNEKSIDLIDELYKAGAVKVIAVEIKTYSDGSQNTGKLVIMLPTEPEARKRLFDWEAKQSVGLGFDPETDFGQDSLFILLD